MRTLRLCLAFLTIMLNPLFAENKPHEIWWEHNLIDNENFDLFAHWLGGVDANSRVLMRQYIKEKGYTTLLDAPCGLCIDFYGIQQDKIPILYVGLDITPQLVSKGREHGVPCFLGSIEKIPFGENVFDVAYSRHILEHLDKYEQALNELIRVAKKEVMVVFFIRPSDCNENQIISTQEGELLYHNIYSKQKMENFILSHPKTARFEWQEVDEKEVILHLYLS